MCETAAEPRFDAGIEIINWLAIYLKRRDKKKFQSSETSIGAAGGAHGSFLAAVMFMGVFFKVEIYR